MKVNTIAGFYNPGSSGLIQVQFTDGTFTYIEAGHGMRQFVHCFGSPKEAIGQTIEWAGDGDTLMASFQSVEE